MATTTRKKKTIADLKADLAAAKKKVALLEQKAYQGELIELIKSSNIASDYCAIRGKLKDVSDAAILMGIAKACGAKRMQISQLPAKPRVVKLKPETKVVKASAKKPAAKK